MGEEETEKSPKPREDDTVRVLPSFLPSFLQSSLDLESALAPETPEQTEQETKEGKDGREGGNERTRTYERTTK